MPGEIEKASPAVAGLMRLSAERGAELAPAQVKEADSWVYIFAQTVALAEYVQNTDFVPESMRGNPAMITAAIMAGREMNLGPMAALKHINVIKGRPSQSAEIMRAKVLEAGHEIRFIEQSDTRVKVEGRRKGQSSWTPVVFTADQAKRMGLNLTGDTARGLGKYTPEDKLIARATSRLCRRLFSDVISGLPTVDEAEDADVVDEPGPATTERPRTARRRPMSTGQPSDTAVPVTLEPVPDLPAEPIQETPPDHAEPVEAEPSTSESTQDATVDQPEPEQDPEQAARAILEAELGARPVEEPAPNPVTANQLRAIGTLFTRTVKATNDEDRHIITSGIAGRVIRSWNDLTKMEAGHVIDRISNWGTAKDEQIALMRKRGSELMDAEEK